MKLWVSTDVGTCTNLLTFGTDLDHSPDPGTGFWNFRGISQQVMDRFQ